MLGIRKLALSGVFALALAGTALSTVYAGAGQDHKVTLCHWAHHKYVAISVADAAVPAHVARGDVTLDDYGECPGG